MNDEELANELVAAGVGQTSNMPHQSEVHYRLTGQIGSHFEWRTAEQFVNDWRVAGAMMEKAPLLSYTISSGHWNAWVRDHSDRGISGPYESLPRAINEAGVEALKP